MSAPARVVVTTGTAKLLSASPPAYHLHASIRFGRAEKSVATRKRTPGHEALTRIKIRAHRVFREFAWARRPSHTFGQFNVIYGWNGWGKRRSRRCSPLIEKRTALLEGEVELELGGTRRLQARPSPRHTASAVRACSTATS